MSDNNTHPAPRIPPLEPDQWSEEARAALKNWDPPLNFHKTMAHNPTTLKNWIGFGEGILFDNLLDLREREIVILRVAYNMHCEYEWGAHAAFAKREGCLNDEELTRLCEGHRHPEWRRSESALIAAVDDLTGNGGIGDDAWDRLMQDYTPAHIIDLIYLAGEFIMVGMFMKSFKLIPEPGFEPFPGTGAQAN